MTRLENLTIQSIIEDNLVSYAAILAKVTAVEANGLLISVLDLNAPAGSSAVDKVPVVKNPYINTPVNVDDLVLLFKTHNQGSLIETDSLNEAEVCYSYIAIPFSTKSSFIADNETTLFSKGKQSTLTLTDKGLSIQTGDEPLLINNAVGSLADCMNELVDLVDSLKQAIQVTGQATLAILPSYDAKKEAVSQKLSKIVK